MRRGAGLLIAALALIALCAPVASGANTLALQPDGKIVVAGYGFPAFGGIVRYNPDGSLDRTFARRGVLIDPHFASFSALALQPDGKIVAGAHQSGLLQPDFTPMLGRYLSDGSPDLSFGEGGRAFSPPEAAGINPSAILIRADGNLAVGVNHDWLKLFSPGTGAADLYTADGGFAGVAGYLPGGDSPADATEISDLLAQSDGSLIGAGSSSETAGGSVIARFVPGSGTPFDAGFGGKGLIPVGRSAGNASSAGANALLSDEGKVLVVGGANNQVTLTRYSPTGEIDPSFGEGGVVYSPLNGTAPVSASAAAIQPDGKILVAGTVNNSKQRQGVAKGCSQCFEALLARFTPDGRLDPSFGEGGVVHLRNANGETLLATGGDVSLLPDGEVILLATPAGGFATAAGEPGFVLARFDASGALDAHFGSGGVVTTLTCPGTEAKKRRNGCLPKPRISLRLSGLSGPRPRVQLRVKPNLSWAWVHSVQLLLPHALQMHPGSLKGVKTVATGGRCCSRTVVKPHAHSIIFKQVNGKSLSVTLRAGAVKPIDKITAGRRLAFRVKVRFRTGESWQTVLLRRTG